MAENIVAHHGCYLNEIAVVRKSGWVVYLAEVVETRTSRRNPFDAGDARREKSEGR